MTAAMAAQAIHLAVGERSAEPRLVAAGRSSSAWSAPSSSGDWIVRIPVPESGRLLSYRSEARIGDLLHALGHPVATWSVVEVEGTCCSVGPFLRGRPVDPGEHFDMELAAGLGRLLSDLHHLDSTGFGPLVDDDRTLHGRSGSCRTGIVDRWFHARIWPFDRSDLADHFAIDLAPDLVEPIERIRDRIVDAAGGPVGVVHSDLHRDHILRDGTGALAAVLDFGDAFRGSCAWDFALLQWYYGHESARRVAAGYPGAADLQAPAAHLAVAVGLYKLAKNPGDPAGRVRLDRALRAVT